MAVAGITPTPYSNRTWITLYPGTTDGFALYDCKQCGAMVRERQQEAHTRWHETLKASIIVGMGL